MTKDEMFLLPSPLVGEGGRDAKHRGRVRGLSPRKETPHPAHFARHLLPQGEKGKITRLNAPHANYSRPLHPPSAALTAAPPGTVRPAGRAARPAPLPP